MQPRRENVYENADGTRRQNVYADNRQGNGDRRQGQNGNQGDRRRNQGGFNRNNNGDRPQRPYGERGGRGDGNQRPYQNNRPGQNGGQGDRNGGKGNSYRGKESGGRLDRELDRFNKEAVAAPDELRGKESRERDKDRNKNAKQRNDYDALGGKKQERFVNLEKNGGKKKPQQPQPKQEEDVIRTLVLPEKLTIKELADKMKVQPAVIVKKLFLKGTMVTVNQEVDYGDCRRDRIRVQLHL